MNRSTKLVASALGLCAGIVACSAIEGLGPPPEVGGSDAGQDVDNADVEPSRDASDAAEPTPDASGRDASDASSLDAFDASVLGASDADGLDASDADVVDAGPAFALTLLPSSVSIVSGSDVDVAVSLVETGGFSGTVSVLISNLPPGVTAAPLQITPPGGTLVLRADASAPLAVVRQANVRGIRAGVLQPPAVPLSVVIQGPRGTLDTSFGSGGIATIDVPSGTLVNLSPHALLTGSDGDITFGGNDYSGGGYEVFVGRVTESGNPDTTFVSDAGLYRGQASNMWGSCQALSINAAGELVLFGYVVSSSGENSVMFASVLDPSGDAGTFGNGTGIVTIGGTVVDEKSFGAVITPENVLVLAGFDPYGIPAMVALLSDGSPDLSFDPPIVSGIGALNITDAGGYANINDVSALPNGDVLGAMQGNDFVLLAVAPNGTIDQAYGKGGVATVPVPGLLTAGFEGANSVKSAADGTTLCVGSTSGTVEIARLTPTGQPDPGFGIAGHTSTPMLGALAWSTAATFEGGAVAGVTGSADGGAQMGVVRYDVKGKLDTAFTGTGSAFIPAPSVNATLVAVDAAGRIVLAAGTGSTVTLARFWP